jgi:hypothetical protein
MSVDQQLDAASAGLTNNLPGMNIFGAGRSTMAVLPEMMQLGDVMRMRADQTKDAYSIRGLERAEQSAFAEADQFGLFQEHVKSTAEMDPTSQAKANRDFLNRHPEALTNSFIKDSLATQEAINSGVIKSRQDELAEAQVASGLLDVEQDKRTRREREQTATLQASTALQKAKIDASALQVMIDNNELEQAGKLGQALGRTGGLDQIVKEDMMILGERFAQNPVNVGLKNGIANIAFSFSKANSIAESYNQELSEHSSTIDFLGKNKIDVSPGRTPEELAAGFAAARELAGKQTNPIDALNKINRLEAATTKFGGFISQAKLREEAFRNDLAGVMEGGNSPEALEKARELIMRWTMKSAAFDGTLNQIIERDTMRLDNRKKQLELDSKTSSIMNSEKRLTIAEKALALRQAGVRFAANESVENKKLKLFGIVSQREGAPTDAQELTKEVDELMNALDLLPSFDGTTDINLTD